MWCQQRAHVGVGTGFFLWIFFGVRFGALGLYGAKNTGILTHFAAVSTALPA